MDVHLSQVDNSTWTWHFFEHQLTAFWERRFLIWQHSRPASCCSTVVPLVPAGCWCNSRFITCWSSTALRYDVAFVWSLKTVLSHAADDAMSDDAKEISLLHDICHAHFQITLVPGKPDRCVTSTCLGAMLVGPRCGLPASGAAASRYYTLGVQAVQHQHQYRLYRLYSCCQTPKKHL
jgi:hypothetical protein